MKLIDFNWNGSHCIVVAPEFSLPLPLPFHKWWFIVSPIILAQNMPTLPLSSLCAMRLDARLCVSICCRQWDIMMSEPAAPAPPSARGDSGPEPEWGEHRSQSQLPGPGQSHWGGCPAITGTQLLPVKWHTSAPQQTPSTSPPPRPWSWRPWWS